MLKEFGERPHNYSSPAMLERRKRILREAREVIAERGIAGLNMTEIGQRAGVAKRTLYNAFQTRERMIATAIQEYFEAYIDHLPYEHPPGSMMRNVERLVSLVQRNQDMRNYVRAVHAIYFSSEVDSGIWTTLHAMTRRPTAEWIKALDEGGHLQSWIDAEQLTDDLVRHTYATMNDWSHGRIADYEIAVRLVVSYNTIVAGATHGAAREEIETLQIRIAAQGNAALPVPKRPLPPGAD